MTNDSEPPDATVDTNLFVSSFINPLGRPGVLQRAMRDRRFRPVLSTPLRSEYRRVLEHPDFQTKYRLDRQEISSFLDLTDEIGRFVEPVTSLPVAVRDLKDEMVLATALAAPTGYLITGDGDLYDLRDEPALAPLRIVTVREFLDALGIDPA